MPDQPAAASPDSASPDVSALDLSAAAVTALGDQSPDATLGVAPSALPDQQGNDGAANPLLLGSTTVRQTVFRLSDRSLLQQILAVSPPATAVTTALQSLVAIVHRLRTLCANDVQNTTFPAGWQPTPENLAIYASEEAWDLLEQLHCYRQYPEKSAAQVIPEAMVADRFQQPFTLDWLTPNLLWCIGRQSYSLMQWLGGVRAMVTDPTAIEPTPQTGVARLVAILEIQTPHLQWSVDLVTLTDPPPPLQWPAHLPQDNGTTVIDPASWLEQLTQQLAQAMPELGLLINATHVELLVPGHSWQLGSIHLRFQLAFLADQAMPQTPSPPEIDLQMPPPPTVAGDAAPDFALAPIDVEFTPLADGESAEALRPRSPIGDPLTLLMEAESPSVVVVNPDGPELANAPTAERLAMADLLSMLSEPEPAATKETASNEPRVDRPSLADVFTLLTTAPETPLPAAMPSLPAPTAPGMVTSPLESLTLELFQQDLQQRTEPIPVTTDQRSPDQPLTLELFQQELDPMLLSTPAARATEGTLPISQQSAAVMEPIAVEPASGGDNSSTETELTLDRFWAEPDTPSPAPLELPVTSRVLKPEPLGEANDRPPILEHDFAEIPVENGVSETTGPISLTLATLFAETTVAPLDGPDLAARPDQPTQASEWTLADLFSGSDPSENLSAAPIIAAALEVDSADSAVQLDVPANQPDNVQPAIADRLEEKQAPTSEISLIDLWPDLQIWVAPERWWNISVYRWGILQQKIQESLPEIWQVYDRQLPSGSDFTPKETLITQLVQIAYQLSEILQSYFVHPVSLLADHALPIQEWLGQIFWLVTRSSYPLMQLVSSVAAEILIPGQIWQKGRLRLLVMIEFTEQKPPVQIDLSTQTLLPVPVALLEAAVIVRAEHPWLSSPIAIAELLPQIRDRLQQHSPILAALMNGIESEVYGSRQGQQFAQPFPLQLNFGLSLEVAGSEVASTTSGRGL